MLSYNNDENIKNLLIQEMIKHKDQDQFIKGKYSENNGPFKGCSIGCTIDSVNKILGESYPNSSHESLYRSVGIPTWSARLQDTLFEGIPNEEGAQFSIDFLSAIPVGVNIEPVRWKFCVFILKECTQRVSSQGNISEQVKEKVLNAIRDVLILHENAIGNNKWDLSAQRACWISCVSTWSANSELWGTERLSGYEKNSIGSIWSSASAARASCVSDPAEAARFCAWSACHLQFLDGIVAYKRYANEIIRLLKLVC